jgi:dTDP-4-dehydrorhamnose 3,5-epimerase
LNILGSDDKNLIQDVEIKKLKPIQDERGFLMEILRSDEPIFNRFGQCYVTAVHPGIVKGWHYHRNQYDHFVCLSGAAKVVLYDGREDSKTYREVDEFILSLESPMLVKIPPYVFHGFTAAGDKDALILNLPTEPYNYKEPDEFRESPFSDKIPYDWGFVDRAKSR